MALVDTTWYVNAGDQATTGYYAIAKRPQNTAVVAGQIVRQFTAPAVGSERVFICIIAGTTANVTDATWVLTRGSKTTDGTATWMECGGQASLNGDLVNTTTWAAVKASGAVLGQIIKRSNNASYQICTTTGAMSAAEPAMSDTAGVTTTDTTAVWTSLGPVSNFTGGQAPHARVTSAIAVNWFAAGNTVYIGDNSAESQSATTLNHGGSASTIGKFISHNHSGSYPPSSSDLMAGASISTTGSAVIVSPGGPTYFYGVSFLSGVGSSLNISLALSNPAGGWLCFENCILKIASNNVNGQVQIGSGGPGTILFRNTKVGFTAIPTLSAVGVAYANFVWQDTAPILIAGSAVPTTFLGQIGAGTNVPHMILEALDLSQITGIIFSQPTTAGMIELLIKDCKLNASATISTPTNTGVVAQLVRSSA